MQEGAALDVVDSIPHDDAQFIVYVLLNIVYGTEMKGSHVHDLREYLHRSFRLEGLLKVSACELVDGAKDK